MDETRFCSRCGRAVANDDVFCGKCGTPLRPANLQPAMARVVEPTHITAGPSQPHSISPARVIASLMMIATLVGIGYYVMGHRPSAASPTPVVSASELAASSARPTPTSTPIPTPTSAPTAVPTPALDFSAIALSGKGNKVPKFTIPVAAAAMATITNSGGANFAVWSIGADGSKQELLVNVIGKYSGTVLFDTGSGEHSVAFEVDSSGSWTITVKPVQMARVWDGSSKLSGTGDDVVMLVPPSQGLTTEGITYSGSSNFAVWSYADTSRDLLVNVIGKYSGQSLLPSGTDLLQVEAGGAWTVAPQ